MSFCYVLDYNAIGAHTLIFSVFPFFLKKNSDLNMASIGDPRFSDASSVSTRFMRHLTEGT